MSKKDATFSRVELNEESVVLSIVLNVDQSVKLSIALSVDSNVDSSVKLSFAQNLDYTVDWNVDWSSLGGLEWFGRAPHGSIGASCRLFTN